MRSIALSRSVFGSARISLIHAALLAGTTLIAANARAQLTETSQPSGSLSGSMEHKETPTPLRELVQEAEQKNPQIAAVFHGVAGLTKCSQAGFCFSRDPSLGAAVQCWQSTAFCGLQQQRVRLYRVRRVAGHSLSGQTASCAPVSPNTRRTRWKRRPIQSAESVVEISRWSISAWPTFSKPSAFCREATSC